MRFSASDRLRAAGLRRTPARLAVLARIEALDRPVTQGERLDEPDLGELDAVTPYRTLSALVQAGPGSAPTP